MLTRRTLIATLPALALPATLNAAAPRAPLVGRIALDRGRLYTSARINGEQLLFVIDSGASQNFIRPEIAARLKLAAVNTRDIAGLGSRVSTVKAHVARDVIVGNIARQPQMTFLNYDFGRGLPEDAAGLLAAGVLTSYATQLDFVKGEWSLYLDGLPALDSFRPWPGRIARKEGDASARLIVEAALDGNPLRLHLDTGSPRSLLLFPQAAARLNLFDRPGSVTEVTTRGFGGESKFPSRHFSGGTLQIGKFRFEEIGYTVMDPREARRLEDDGVIGLELMRLFDWGIDPRGNRMLVRRNALAYEQRTPPPAR